MYIRMHLQVLANHLRLAGLERLQSRLDEGQKDVSLQIFYNAG